MTTQQKKTNIFITGAHKVLNAALPYSRRWRMLYRTMHKIDDLYTYGPSPALQDALENISKILSMIPSKNLKELATKLPDMELLYNFEKLNLLQHQRGERIKNMARLIMFNMINTIIENNEEIVVMNYNLLDEKQRIDFITKTLMATHKKISVHIPAVSDAVRTVIVDYEYDTKYPDEPARAYYDKSAQLIGLCPLILSDDNINSVIATMSHEYVHALQAVYKSALPTPILKFSWEYYNTMHKLPHSQRTIEKEANKVTRMVRNSFNTRFQQAVFEPDKYAKDANKFTTPPTRNDGRN